MSTPSNPSLRNSLPDNDDFSSASSNSELSDTETMVKLMHACDVCRRKKVKCDGGKPSCASCLRLKIECTYSPLIRKKKVRRSAIQKIEGRLESVEQVLVNLAAAVEATSEDQDESQDPLATENSETAVSERALSHISKNGPKYADVLKFLEGDGTLRYNNIPEIEILKNNFIELILKKITTSIPILTFCFRIPLTVEQIRKKELPSHLVYAIIAVGLRYIDKSQLSNPETQDSIFAAKSANIISEIMEDPDINFIISAILLVLFYWSTGNNESSMIYLGIAIRGAERHRLYQIDEHYCGFKRIFKRDWEDKEYKRRIWWICYILDRSMMLNSSLPPSVPDEDCVVDFPSCDYAWKFTEQELVGRPAEIISEDSTRVVLSTQNIPDTLWIICNIYTVIGKVCQFANRRRINYQQSEFYSYESPDSIDNKSKLIILATELGDIKSKLIDKFRLVSPNDFPPTISANQTVTDSMKEASVHYFSLHMIYESAKIILFRSELVFYEHETIPPEGIKTAKQICIESALQLTNLLQWALDNVPINLWDSQTSFWAFTAATILVNAQFLSEHPLVTAFTKGLEIIFKALNAQSEYFKISLLYLGTIQELTKRRELQIKNNDDDLVGNLINNTPDVYKAVSINANEIAGKGENHLIGLDPTNPSLVQSLSGGDMLLNINSVVSYKRNLVPASNSSQSPTFANTAPPRLPLQNQSKITSDSLFPPAGNPAMQQKMGSQFNKSSFPPTQPEMSISPTQSQAELLGNSQNTVTSDKRRRVDQSTDDSSMMEIIPSSLNQNDGFLQHSQNNPRKNKLDHQFSLGTEQGYDSRSTSIPSTYSHHVPSNPDSTQERNVFSPFSTNNQHSPGHNQQQNIPLRGSRVRHTHQQQPGAYVSGGINSSIQEDPNPKFNTQLMNQYGTQSSSSSVSDGVSNMHVDPRSAGFRAGGTQGVQNNGMNFANTVPGGSGGQFNYQMGNPKNFNPVGNMEMQFSAGGGNRTQMHRQTRNEQQQGPQGVRGNYGFNQPELFNVSDSVSAISTPSQNSPNRQKQQPNTGYRYNGPGGTDGQN
ncbi:hypothetical protein BB558_000223 [Smittium angustum]|uniref:Zn(2)-C6 fungal-type domain-containing protein n=1 Tax=Smittium angustum TaxID=133377 RepID=A0A2U1JEV1_SMIAN|nr:hypothetical protein BB558_000223 [Smittium angustum]